MRLKILPFFFLVVLFFSSWNILASDTLTRRQIFNFDVGDSLYYKSAIDYKFPAFSKSDNLQIILGKDYSLDSSEVSFTIKSFIKNEAYNGGLTGSGYTSLDTVIETYKDLDSSYVQGFDLDTSIYNNWSLGRTWYDSLDPNWSLDSLLDLRSFIFSYDSSYDDVYDFTYTERLGTTLRIYGQGLSLYYRVSKYELVGFVLADGRKWGTLFKAFPVGISETLTSTLSIYPNPFTDKLHIDFDESITNGNSTIVVRDIYGKVIKELKDLYQQNEISLSVESPGLYFLTLQSETNSKTWKVMKE